MLLNRLTYVHKCLSKWPKNIPLKVVWTRNLILAPCQVCDSCVLRRCENSDHRSSLQDGFSIRFRYVQTSPIIDMRNDEIIKDNNNNDVEGGDRTFGSSVTKVRGWKEKDWLKELVTSTNSALSPQQWKQTKMNALAERLFVAGNFESRVMLTCSIFHNFSLAKSLMDYMECEQITPNIVTLSKYLRLCGDYEGEPNEKQIMTIFHRITDNQSLFDSATAEDVIHGLCRTSAWKESFRFLDMIKRTCDTPSSSVLLPIILAAFRNKDYEVGWNLMGELVLRCQGSMLIDAIKAWLVECTNADEISRFPMVDKLLRFLNKHEVIISREVAQIIKYCFERRLNEEWTGSFTKVTNSGFCQTCKFQLETLVLPNEEFIELRNCFIERVLKGNDMFLKSTPAEIKRFLNFVENTAPYSIVFDGLNVAYSVHSRRSSRFQLATNLLKVVKKFANNKHKILILGRQHMDDWPYEVLKEIKKDAYIFKVDNLSEDDPFLLYAAMYSGQGTKFLTRDMMRDHSYCLGDSRLKVLFRKWQRGHHLELLQTAVGLQFKMPIEYNPVAQCAEGRWHIPYQDEITNQSTTTSISNTWLCLKSGQKSQHLTKVM